MIVDSVELLRMIRDGKIENGQPFKYVKNGKFEILSEEEEEISIDGMLEMIYPENWSATDVDIVKIVKKINELIKAVKQLNRKISKDYCCNCGTELTEENKALPNMCNECKYGLER